MKTIGAYQAKVHLSEVLNQVARGESFTVTKRGKPVATISPAATDTRHGPKNLVEDFRRQHAKSLKQITLQQIAEMKEMGRR